MSGPDFRVGDRIRIIREPTFDSGLYRLGWTGCVVRCGGSIGVEFDPGLQTVHGTNYGIGTPSPGCCRWWVERDCLVLDGPRDYANYDEGGVV